MAKSLKIAPADWPTYNCEATGSRYNRAEAALKPSNVDQLVLKWKFPIDDFTDCNLGIVRCTPSVVNGYVYFGTTTQPSVYKLTPNGRVKWSFQHRGPDGKLLGGHIYSSPLVTEKAVYVGDTHGYIYCLDRKTGKPLWIVNTRDKAFPAAHILNTIYSSPIAVGDTVVIGGGGGEQGVAQFNPSYPSSNNNGHLLALDAKTGTVRWIHQLGRKPEPLDPPIVINDAFGCHVFRNGPSTSGVWCTPSYDAETKTIYCGTDTNNSPGRPTKERPNGDTDDCCSVIALDAESGRRRWVCQLHPNDMWILGMSGYDPGKKQYLDQSVGDTPKVYSIDQGGKKTRVVGVGCKDGAFYVINAADGSILAHTPLFKGGPEDREVVPPGVLALPGVAGGLQTGCADGKTVYTNGTDYIRLLTVGMLPSVSGPPTGGRICAIRPDAKQEVWRHERSKYMLQPQQEWVGDPVASGIALAGDVVFFTTLSSKRLVALDAASGKLLKEFPLPALWAGPSVSRGRVYVGSGMIASSDEPALRRFAYANFENNMKGAVHCFGLPGVDEVDRMEDGSE